jgi:hypothetical protein
VPDHAQAQIDGWIDELIDLDCAILALAPKDIGRLALDDRRAELNRKIDAALRMEPTTARDNSDPFAVPVAQQSDRNAA